MRRASLSPTVVTTRTDATVEPRPGGVDRLAWWLDNAITVPGTRFRIGFDALIGLIPGVGDLIGTLLSSYIIAVAAAQGLPASALARMAINVGVEAIVGAVLIVGDLFDAVWKANQRNIAITFIVILGIAAFAIVRWLVDALAGAG